MTQTSVPVAWEYLCGEVWVLSGVKPAGMFKDCLVRPLYRHPEMEEKRNAE